jgi:hypothetical protein
MSKDSGHRSPKTQKERRDTVKAKELGIRVRGRRKALPDSYDDLHKSAGKHGWKQNRRKHQYREDMIEAIVEAAMTCMGEKPPEAAWRKVHRHISPGKDPKSKSVFRHARKHSRGPDNPKGKYRYDFQPGAEQFHQVVDRPLWRETSKGKAVRTYKIK